MRFLDSTGLGRRVRLTNDPDPDNDPTYSPDGSKILFSRTVSGTEQLWVMNAGGGGEVMIGTGDEPTWSPDGTRIAFVSGGTIWTADANGSNRVNTGVSGEEPAWR